MRAVEAATPLTLASVADRMAQGIRTSCNEVFVLEVVDARRSKYRSAQLGRDVELEAQWLRPFLDAESMRRYEIVPPTKVVIVPYERRENRMRLVDSHILKSTSPLLWKYLKHCEDILRKREDSRFDNDEWYCFGRNQNIDLINVPKLLVPDIVNAGTFGLDDQGRYAFVSGYGITLKPEFAPHRALMLAILNSTSFSEYLRTISTPLRGGWFRTFPQFMSRVPIKLPETAEEEKLAVRIEESVKQLTAAKAKLRQSRLSDREREQQEQTADGAEKRIDADVLMLYGIATQPEMPRRRRTGMRQGRL